MPVRFLTGLRRASASPNELRPAFLPLLPALLLCAFGLLLAPPVYAVHESLWELGIGVGSLSTPHYRGSKSEANVALPFPYVIYRGDILQVDNDEGIRGELFENEDIRFDLSLAGSVPVPDTDTGARSGMPGLDPLIEVGAELNATLWRASERDHRFSVVVPLRMVYSVGNPLFEFQGLTLSPYLDYRIRQQDETMLASYGVSIGPIYATNLYHEYFYEVTSEFATPARPAYDAHGGYGGSRITLSAKWHFKKFMIGVFARYDTLDGAVFEDSPLVETNDYFIVGTVFAWILNKSDNRGAH
jgi:outer membrane scaffolding protein for murein synthesis (MipA/OmpV family)